MAPSRWSSPGGAGLRKKYDVPYSGHRNILSRPSWSIFRRRRFILSIITVTAMFFFIKNIPTDVPPVSQRYSPTFGNLAPSHIQSHLDLQEEQSIHETQSSGQQKDGSVLLPNLVASKQQQFDFDNVLFAFSSLASTSNLLPIACQMAQHNRSNVHIALLGKQDISIEKLMSISGIAVADCPVSWHDARPDLSLELSNPRVEASIKIGFGYVCNVVLPQVVLVEPPSDNDLGHIHLLQAVADERDIQLIHLPSNAQQALSWISVLDSSSLKNFNKVEIEIVIQAYSESAGSLIRLLRSIESANYNGLFFPRITVELPSQIDTFVTDYLEQLRWPPASVPAESRLTLRHRMRTRTSTAHDGLLQTVESFYPRAASTSHVLLLSPDAELSSSYLHYLMLILLEYKYGLEHKDTVTSLFGISLELPEQLVDIQQPVPGHGPSKQTPLVLSQTPNSNAALITGNKWIESHTFLTQRLERDPYLSKKPEATVSLKERHTQWSAEMLDLMQARGLYMLYPAFATEDGVKLVTLHQDLRHPSEEHLDSNGGRKHSYPANFHGVSQDDLPSSDRHESLVVDSAPALATLVPLQRLLSDRKKGSIPALPPLAALPLFTFQGESTSWSASQRYAAKFSADFAQQRGNCNSLESQATAVLGLFCDSG